MTLPVDAPISPMLAKAADALPSGPGWCYEPKWDGFRCIVYRDGDDVELGSRNERPLTRYFPELRDPILHQLPDRCVLDGELIVPDRRGSGLDFDALLQRIHPAETRVRRLAADTPASFVAFDLLALDDRSLLDEPFSARRSLLESVMRTCTHPLYVTPLTHSNAEAADWFVRFEGAGLDGIVAKRSDVPYRPGERVMVKVKHERTADCVVAGYRIHKDGKGAGSLLLGLFDDAARLHHVGVAASFTAKFRLQLLIELSPLIDNELVDHPWREWAEMQAHEATRMPGAQSRWNAGKDLSFVPIKPERVAEVHFSQLQGNRFRHGAKFLRWRTDRDPASCSYAQLEVATPMDLRELF